MPSSACWDRFARSTRDSIRARQGPPPLDCAVLAIDFASGVTGTLATVRATPFYWRVHVFGTKGSAEVLDEVTMVLRKSGGQPQVMSYPPIDVLAAELDAFADAIEHKHPFPVAEAEVLATLAAFEAALAVDADRDIRWPAMADQPTASGDRRAIATLPPDCRRKSGSAAIRSEICCRPRPN